MSHSSVMPQGAAVAEARRAMWQELVDRAAQFHLYAVPDRKQSGAALRDPGSQAVTGVRVCQPVHRFHIGQELPAQATGLRAVNTVGPAVGQVELCCLIIGRDLYARPSEPVPAVPLDRAKSQRIVITDSRIRLSSGDGFSVFGAGRLFPVLESGQPKLLAAAVCDLTEGWGAFRGRVGNLTMCGELSKEFGFLGHMMVRVLDPERTLLVEEPIPPPSPVADPDPSATFLTWIGQKSDDPELENTASFTPEGQLRGLNIPVALKRITVGFDASGGFRVNPIRTGEVIGKEVGFGKESRPRTPISGTSLTPFQFEGVSEYRFFDGAPRAVGSFTSNVVEGRSFRVDLAGAPGEPALRFGFFGPMVYGCGCFAGAQAMLYGSSGSIFNPPPGIHVISNWYALRVHDPQGKFRAPARGRGR